MRGIVCLLVCSLAVAAGSESQAQESQAAIAEEKILRIEIDFEDSSVDPVVREKNRLYLGPNALQFDTVIDESGQPVSSAIFRRKDQSYLILLHEPKESVVYDVEEFRRYTAKNKALQDRLWERLAEGRPPEEVEALEKMRESKRETASLGEEAMRAGVKLEKTEESGELGGHPWTKYQEYISGSLSREFLVTPWAHLGVHAETSEIFEEIAAFDDQKREISPGMSRVPNPFEHYDEFDGYPLVSRQFDGEGNIVFTATVTSIETMEETEGLFENPGYPEKGMADRVRTLE